MKIKPREIPRYKIGMIETHCHLDYLESEDLDKILAKCFDYGIQKIITISVSPDNLKKVRELITLSEHIYGTQGIHPHEASKFTEEVLSEIKENLKLPKILAVGEIGLDYYYNHSSKDEQIKSFESQLEVACGYDLPVVIHSRDADEDMMAVLANFSKQLKRKGVIHSFTSSLKLGKFCLDEGFYLGFNGIITFKTADNVRNVLKETPLDKILIETDSPFLTPVPYRGKENAPFYLPFIAERIALEKKVEVEEILKKTTENALKLFDLR